MAELCSAGGREGLGVHGAVLAIAVLRSGDEPDRYWRRSGHRRSRGRRRVAASGNIQHSDIDIACRGVDPVDEDLQKTHDIDWNGSLAAYKCSRRRRCHIVVNRHSYDAVARRDYGIRDHWITQPRLDLKGKLRTVQHVLAYVLVDTTFRRGRSVAACLARIERQVCLRATTHDSTRVHRTLVATRDSFLISRAGRAARNAVSGTAD